MKKKQLVLQWEWSFWLCKKWAPSVRAFSHWDRQNANGSFFASDRRLDHRQDRQKQIDHRYTSFSAHFHRNHCDSMNYSRQDSAMRYLQKIPPICRLLLTGDRPLQSSVSLQSCRRWDTKRTQSLLYNSRYFGSSDFIVPHVHANQVKWSDKGSEKKNHPKNWFSDFFRQESIFIKRPFWMSRTILRVVATPIPASQSNPEQCKGAQRTMSQLTVH